MTITQTITTPPTAPDRDSDTPEEFSDSMDAFLTYVATLVSDMNTWATQANGTQGSWTPTLEADGIALTSVTYDAVTSGQYSRIGDIIFIQGILRTDAVTVGSANGNVVIGGLPFTSDATNGRGTISVGFASNWDGDIPIEGLIELNKDTIFLYSRATADVNSANVAVADIKNAADANVIYFSGQYIAVAA